MSDATISSISSQRPCDVARYGGNHNACLTDYLNRKYPPAPETQVNEVLSLEALETAMDASVQGTSDTLAKGRGGRIRWRRYDYQGKIIRDVYRLINEEFSNNSNLNNIRLAIKKAHSYAPSWPGGSPKAITAQEVENIGKLLAALEGDTSYAELSSRGKILLYLQEVNNLAAGAFDRDLFSGKEVPQETRQATYDKQQDQALVAMLPWVQPKTVDPQVAALQGEIDALQTKLTTFLEEKSAALTRAEGDIKNALRYKETAIPSVKTADQLLATLSRGKGTLTTLKQAVQEKVDSAPLGTIKRKLDELTNPPITLSNAMTKLKEPLSLIANLGEEINDILSKIPAKITAVEKKKMELLAQAGLNTFSAALTEVRTNITELTTAVGNLTSLKTRMDSLHTAAAQPNAFKNDPRTIHEQKSSIASLTEDKKTLVTRIEEAAKTISKALDDLDYEIDTAAEDGTDTTLVKQSLERLTSLLDTQIATYLETDKALKKSAKYVKARLETPGFLTKLIYTLPGLGPEYAEKWSNIHSKDEIKQSIQDSGFWSFFNGTPTVAEKPEEASPGHTATKGTDAEPEDAAQAVSAPQPDPILDKAVTAKITREIVVEALSNGYQDTQENPIAKSPPPTMAPEPTKPFSPSDLPHLSLQGEPNLERVMQYEPKSDQPGGLTRVWQAISQPVSAWIDSPDRWWKQDPERAAEARAYEEGGERNADLQEYSPPNQESSSTTNSAGQKLIRNVRTGYSIITNEEEQ